MKFASDLNNYIPHGMDGPQDFDEWLTEANVDLALCFYIKECATSTDSERITVAKTLW